MFSLEFRQLEYFLAVSKLNSFTLAANTLFVTQPTITSAIRALEEELGIKLFDRSQKRVVLTVEGEIFLKHVQHVMRDVSTALSEINDLKVLGRGFVRLAVSPLLMTDFLPKLYTRFKGEYPALELQLREASVADTQKLLDNDDVDFAVMPMPRTTVSLDVVRLFSTRLAVYLHRDHPLAKASAFPIEKLNDASLIVLDEAFLPLDMLAGAFPGCEFKPRILYSSSQLTSLWGLAASNIGLTILPEQNYCIPDPIIGLPLHPVQQLDFCMMNKKNRYLSNAAQTFANFIKQYLPKQKG